MADQPNITVADFAKYLPKGYQPKVVLDLGAHVGQEAREFHATYGEAQIYAFEASPTIARMCARVMRGHPRVSVVAQAVTDTDGMMTFYHTRLSRNCWYGSSLLPCDRSRPIQVKATRLDTWLEMMKIGKVDLIWADLQGGEPGALRGLGDRIKEVDAILLEVWYQAATYTGLTMFPDLNKWILSKGFKLAVNRPTNDIWGDAIWVRKDLA